MQVSASFGTALTLNGHERPGSAPQRAADTPEAADTPRASLPAIVPAADDRRTEGARQRVRPAATLVAQLVAAAEDHPSSRARRRADPGVGTERYRAIGMLGAAPARVAARTI